MILPAGPWKLTESRKSLRDSLSSLENAPRFPQLPPPDDDGVKLFQLPTDSGEAHLKWIE